MLELQYQLEPKAAKRYTTIDIANAFFSIPLAAECRPQFAFKWRGIQYTWNRLPQGWKHSPTVTENPGIKPPNTNVLLKNADILYCSAGCTFHPFGSFEIIIFKQCSHQHQSPG